MLQYVEINQSYLQDLFTSIWNEQQFVINTNSLIQSKHYLSMSHNFTLTLIEQEYESISQTFTINEVTNDWTLNQ